MNGLTNEPALTVTAVSAGYGQRQILHEINLSLALGDWYCLLGPNGCGKTTLLRVIAGQLASRAGQVLIGGHSLNDAPQQAKRLLGFAHASEKLPPLLTGRQCLEVYAAGFGLDSLTETLELAAALNLIDALSERVAAYSLGMRQKLAIVLSMVGDPKLLVLDEAFNGLDPASAFFLKGFLAKRTAMCRSAVLLATHALDMAPRHATRTGLLQDGRLIHEWGITETSNLRALGIDAFEQAIASASMAAGRQTRCKPA
jgi:ABC-2 type transport system ATP-binding protein